jgi:type II secretion system protein J
MKRGHTGFTLLELLVVLSVLSIVSTLGLYVYFGMSDQWNIQLERERLNSSATAIFTALREDIGSLVASERGGVPIFGEDRLFDDPQFIRVQRESDAVTLPVRSTNPATDRAEFLKVRYHLDRSAGMPRLVRTFGPLRGEVPEGASIEVANDVQDLRIQYYDGEQWYEAWEAARHPEALRISVSLGDPRAPRSQISRSAVLPIPVE